MPLDNDDQRPDPDELLAEVRSPRGRLKIFFGALCWRRENLRHVTRSLNDYAPKAWTC